MNLKDELQARGLLQDYTNDIEDVLNNSKPTFYIGADPTSDSLHVGNLVGLITARRLAKAGLKPILIVGGGTGRIGDPKPNAERALLDEKTIKTNIKKIRQQVAHILDRKDLLVVDNNDWLGKLKYIDFLRDIGKHFTVNNLIKKDAIAARLKSDIGLSYTEFAYPLLQAYDYLELFRRYNCRLQIGGSDQWGNIIAGVDLIRRKEEVSVSAFTFPLLVDKSTGKKFGKTEGNAVWLSAEKMSPYKFYQFFINTSDSLVEELLKKLTFISLQEIQQIILEHKKAPQKREAQRILAFEVTKIVHSETSAKEAKALSDVLFYGGDINSLSKFDIKLLLKEAPTFKVKPDYALIDVLKDSELVNSKKEARRMIESNAILLGEERVMDVEYRLQKTDFTNSVALLKKGKKDFIILVI